MMIWTTYQPLCEQNEFIPGDLWSFTFILCSSVSVMEKLDRFKNDFTTY